ARGGEKRERETERQPEELRLPRDPVERVDGDEPCRAERGQPEQREHDRLRARRGPPAWHDTAPLGHRPPQPEQEEERGEERAHPAHDPRLLPIASEAAIIA